MSSIYVNEPATNGKVCLKTTVGDIDIELWAKECPLACRNFVQLCMEGYYNGTIFHRMVKDFIVQGGDPTGTGQGGESIYGHPFKDEFHQRLKFCRRGLVGMANGEKNSNGSQFFFTLAATPDLDKKHTLFGKVVGNTLFNMLRLGEGETDENEKPLVTHKITGCVLLNNPFPDIVPRQKLVERKTKKVLKEEKKEMKRNLGLLSFGDEAEEEEEELLAANSQLKSKSKSAHDILSDDKLSKEPAVRPEELQLENSLIDSEKSSERISRIREKLMKRKRKMEVDRGKDEEDDVEKIISEEMKEKQKQELEKVSAELRALQKSYKKTLKKIEEKKEVSDEDEEPKTDGMKMYRNMRLKFKEKSKKIVKQKDPHREDQTFEILNKFTSKLSEWSQVAIHNPLDEEKEEISEDKNEKEETSKLDLDAEDLPANEWMLHKFEALPEQQEVSRAKDANFKDENEDWYDISDPRNKMNRRRRGEEC